MASEAGERNPGSVFAIAAVMCGFFVMGFVDLVGMITKQAKIDFALSEGVAAFVPSAIFMWFFVCSLPTSLVMNKIGRRNTVLVSLIVTLAAFVLPFVSYTKIVFFVAMALLGIGNTIIQVAMNPLVSNVVSKGRLPSFLSAGQFVKAIASFLGPIVVAKLVFMKGNLSLTFAAYAAATLLALVWLSFSRIPHESESAKTASFGSCLGLLGDLRIAFLFLGILLVVGFDVGFNVYTGQFEDKVWGLPLTSIYFAAKTAGTFLGSFLLAVVPIARLFRVSVVILLAGAGACLVPGLKPDMLAIAVIVASVGAANVFSMIFAWAIQHRPAKANEVSGLLVMGVSGGALTSPLMAQAEGMLGASGPAWVLVACGVYLAALAFLYREKQAEYLNQ